MNKLFLIKTSLAMSVCLTACAGVGNLGDLAKMAQPGEAKKLTATAAMAQKSMYFLDLTKQVVAFEQQRTELLANMESQKSELASLVEQTAQAKADALAAPSEAADARVQELQAQVDSHQKKMESMVAEQLGLESKYQAKVAEFEALKANHDRYGTTVVTGASAKAVASYSASQPEGFTLPQGKYAVVGLNFDRQVLLESSIGDEESRLEPGLLDDSTAYWVGQKLALQQLDSVSRVQVASLLNGQEVLSHDSLAKNAAFVKAGTFVPAKILGMSQPFDYYVGEGYGYFNPMVASKLAEAAQALGVDYLVNLQWKATYAAFDGDWKSNQVQLKLVLEFTLHDATGKTLVTRTFDALSQNKAGTVNNEIYPEAIGWLSGETAPLIWEQVIQASGKSQS